MPVHFDHPKITRVPLMVENPEIFLNVDFDCSKEGSWCTECNTKNLSPLQSTVYEKFKKNCQKFTFLKKVIFLSVFLDFFIKATLQIFEVFCVAFIAPELIFSYQNKHSIIFTRPWPQGQAESWY